MSGTRAKAIALLTGLQLAAGALAAQDAGVRSLFPARPAGHVTDVAAIVDEGAEARITSLAERLRAATGVELAVVTLPTIGDREETDVAREIGRAWGVGARAEIGDQRRNAGIVILVVPRQGGQAGTGRTRVEVGQGLEGIVTDVVAGRIRDLMADRFAGGDYGGGLLLGVEALTGIIARGFGVSDTALTNVRPATEPRGTGGTPLGALPILLFILFLVLSGAAGGRRRRRRNVFWAGPWIGGGFGGGGGWGGGGFGGGGFGGFGGGGGFSGGGAGGRF